MSKLLSVCVPTYNLGENSINYLRENLDSINRQSYENIEVSISDNSTDELVADFVKNYKFREGISLLYCKSARGRGWGASPNTNNAVDQSTGDYVKILFQDDKFFSDQAASLIVDCLKENEWCAFKSMCQGAINSSYFLIPGNFPRTSPEYPQDLLKGLNYIGGPTSVAFRKTDLRMNESFRYLNDCDLYYKFWKEWGPMTIIDSAEPLVVIRMRTGALTDTIPQSDKEQEIRSLQEVYK
jgi:glycosyltransferase involved in cell wall biosynthesis